MSKKESTMPDELKRLVAARGQCKGIITKTERFLQSSSAADIEMLKIKKDRLIAAFNQFSELTIELQVLDPTDRDDFDLTEEIFCKILARLNILLADHTSSNEHDSNSGTGGDSQFQKLPRIVINRFSGNMEKKAAALETLTQTSSPPHYERSRRISLASNLASGKEEKRKIKCYAASCPAA
ncbi:uncharacterized protein [Choristoneura fumiferana]|uniref:uncharacterized protein n=1 Tax=Choristoneura fumiferana TaxID=7141 RepID=UPI003D15C47A